MNWDPANRRGAWVCAAVIAIAACALPAAAERSTVRVAPEAAVGGLTVAELAARQRALHTELMAALPSGVNQAAVRVGTAASCGP
jgi:hypothetical protein